MTELLSAWETDQLLRNGGEPDYSWAKKLPKLHLSRYGLYIFESIPTNAPSYARPHWCYSATIQFLRPFGEFHEFDRVEMPSRTWPRSHFVRYHGLWYVIRGGSVIHDGNWWIRWRAIRNDRLAQHLNGYHFEGDQERCGFCLGKMAPRELQIRPRPKVRVISACKAEGMG